MAWTTSPSLSPDQRVKLVVGGNFTLDALGPLHRDTLAAIAADPQAHFRAFQRLYLAARPSRRALTELFLPAFLKHLAPHLPSEARRAARTLLTRSRTLAQAQEAALDEAVGETAVQEITRQRSQLSARMAALARLA
jgi:hypothetical protein